MNNKGFTLVELIATIVILGVILTIAVPSYNSYIEKSKEKKCQADERAILDAVETFVNEELMFKNIFPEFLETMELDEIKISDIRPFQENLTPLQYLPQEYQKYSNIKLKIITTTDNGIHYYNFEIADSSKDDFKQLCK